MYEKFSDRARKVMQLANQEAQRLSHGYIGTEHILLGLVKEGGGVAANILAKHKVGPVVVRTEIEKWIQRGPDVVTMGKLPQTPRSKKVIEYSIEEARSFNHNYVGTEHILLGLLKEGEGVAATVLKMLGITLELARKEIEDFNRDIVKAKRKAVEPQEVLHIAEIDAQVKLASIKGRLLVIAKMIADVLEDLK